MIPELGRSPGEGIDYPLQYSWASFVAQLVKSLPAMRETGFDPWVGKIHWRRDRLPTPLFLGFLCGSAGKESACNVRDHVLSLAVEIKESKMRACRAIGPGHLKAQLHVISSVPGLMLSVSSTVHRER